MVRKLVFQDIQYLNIFEKVTKVRPSDCFNYGLYLIFVVPKHFLSKAIGPNGNHAKKISETLSKRVKVISFDENKEEFIKSILNPIKFNEISFEDGLLVIKAGKQGKALIIGKNSARIKELKSILERYFKIDEIKIS